VRHYRPPFRGPCFGAENASYRALPGDRWGALSLASELPTLRQLSVRHLVRQAGAGGCATLPLAAIVTTTNLLAGVLLRAATLSIGTSTLASGK
jgi:hypothetical protein